jgi:hypothetical protein
MCYHVPLLPGGDPAPVGGSPRSGPPLAASGIRHGHPRKGAVHDPSASAPDGRPSSSGTARPPSTARTPSPCVADGPGSTSRPPVEWPPGPLVVDSHIRDTVHGFVWSFVVPRSGRSRCRCPPSVGGGDPRRGRRRPGRTHTGRRPDPRLSFVRGRPAPMNGPTDPRRERRHGRPAVVETGPVHGGAVDGHRSL